MAQDPASDVPSPSHALDMVAVPGGSVWTEMEADVIRGVLDANGIPCTVVTGAEFPVLGFEVRVPRGRLAEAEQVLAEALKDGPGAATDAESGTENR